MYAEEAPPWDIGRPQPVLVELAERGLLTGRMLDAGCGTGEHALLAAQHGADAIGIDVSRVAIEQARQKAIGRGIDAEFRVADALALELLGRVFDVVVDSGLFHVFEDSERRRYVESLGRVVRKGGMLYITCLSDRQHGKWGPRRISGAEISRAFHADWVLEELRPCVRVINRPEFETWSADAWLAALRHTTAPTATV